MKQMAKWCTIQKTKLKNTLRPLHGNQAEAFLRREYKLMIQGHTMVINSLTISHDNTRS